ALAVDFSGELDWLGFYQSGPATIGAATYSNGTAHGNFSIPGFLSSGVGSLYKSVVLNYTGPGTGIPIGIDNSEAHSETDFSLKGSYTFRPQGTSPPHLVLDGTINAAIPFGGSTNITWAFQSPVTLTISSDLALGASLIWSAPFHLDVFNAPEPGSF